MPLTRPPMTDDTGTKTDGTIVNKALFDAIIDEIDAALDFPGETVVGIIGEVKDARGSQVTLDDRLDVALNEDGTLKTTALPEASLSGALESPDFVVNGDFRVFPPVDTGAGGVIDAPLYWSRNPGTGTLVLTRTGPGETDTTHVGVGFRSIKIEGAANGGLFQRSIPLGRFTAEFAGLVGRTVVAVAHVIANNPSRARLTVFDEVGFTASPYHSGGGGVEVLTVKHTVEVGATRLGINLLNDGTDAVYFGGVSLYVADYAPKGWDFKRPNRNRGLIRAAADNDATTGTGFEEVGRVVLLGNALPVEEPERLPQIHIEAFGDMTADANTKAFRLVVGGTNVTPPTSTANAAPWSARARIVRVNGTTVRVFFSYHIGVSGDLAAYAEVTGLDLTLPITIDLEAQHQTSGVTTRRSFRAWIG